jgi:hypothetical protein
MKDGLKFQLPRNLPGSAILPRLVVHPVQRGEPGGTNVTPEEQARWYDRLAGMVDFD